MRNSEWINITYFSLFVLVAFLLPKITWLRRIRAIAIGISGIALILSVQTLHANFSESVVSVVRDWIPAPLMLFAYWQAGSLFRAPNEKLQARLTHFDRKILRSFSFSNLPEWLKYYFEFSYLLCYPLIPAGLLLLYINQMAQFSDAYWTKVLLPTYFCHAMVPFIQTFPPWMSDPENSGRSRNVMRALNFWIIKHASIHANTLPSAHVTSSMAAAFVLLQFLPVAAFIFMVIAISIGIAAIAGRYHYSLDVILGAAVVALFSCI